MRMGQANRHKPYTAYSRAAGTLAGMGRQFLKTVTYQKMTPEASKLIGEVTETV